MRTLVGSVSLDLFNALRKWFSHGFGQEDECQDGGGDGHDSERNDHEHFAELLGDPHRDVAGGNGSDPGDGRAESHGSVADDGWEEFRRVGIDGCVDSCDGSFGQRHLGDCHPEGYWKSRNLDFNLLTSNF